jgi:hypothetical protein
MYLRLVVSGRPPRRADPARSADRHSPNAASLVQAAEEALARDPRPFPIREGFGLTVVTSSKLPKHRGYGLDDPIIEVLVDVGLIADERLQERFRASSDESLGDSYVVTLSDTSFREQLAACDAQIRCHLDPGEEVLAVGRSADVTELDGMYGWTFVMVTDRALRWITHLDLTLEASLALDGVTGVTERMTAHRYAIDLEHRPLRRLHHVPAHRLLRFEWGNDFAIGVFTRTSIAFSRRDTAAALALRERLAARGLLPVEPLTSEEHEEPPAPSNGL